MLVVARTFQNTKMYFDAVYLFYIFSNSGVDYFFDNLHINFRRTKDF